MPHMGVFNARLINLIILVAILTLAPYFVVRDGRKRHGGWSQALVWAIVSALTFPVDLPVYLLLERRSLAE